MTRQQRRQPCRSALEAERLQSAGRAGTAAVRNDPCVVLCGLVTPYEPAAASCTGARLGRGCGRAGRGVARLKVLHCLVANTPVVAATAVVGACGALYVSGKQASRVAQGSGAGWVGERGAWVRGSRGSTPRGVHVHVCDDCDRLTGCNQLHHRAGARAVACSAQTAMGPHRAVVWAVRVWCPGHVSGCHQVDAHTRT